MSVTPTQHRRFRWLLSCLLLGAMLLRGLVPVGMMPDLSRLSQGAIPLVICTGSGEMTVLMDLTRPDGVVAKVAAVGETRPDGGHGGTGADGTPPGLCPFALTLGWALPVLLALVVLLLVWPRLGTLRPPRLPATRCIFRSDDRLARGPPAGTLIPA
ncbi:DUF2946 family protein [Oleisolibacter albus]|uniref:DUF2946 family protein n=1 Tax=Oleisolibacter albus TaxID=2171757 RepID=UPI000DF26945|nr:DUF2946 family protein [Oleisolibacter albus]